MCNQESLHSCSPVMASTNAKTHKAGSEHHNVTVWIDGHSQNGRSHTTPLRPQLTFSRKTKKPPYATRGMQSSAYESHVGISGSTTCVASSANAAEQIATFNRTLAEAVSMLRMLSPSTLLCSVRHRWPSSDRREHTGFVPTPRLELDVAFSERRRGIRDRSRQEVASPLFTGCSEAHVGTDAKAWDMQQAIVSACAW